MTRKSVNFEVENNLLIFSEPRGGSTWLTETIRRIPGTAVLWEPLHLRHSPIFRELDFTWRQYIPEDADWPEATQAFSSVLRGKEINRWNCMYSSPLAFWTAQRMLVKFCRGNALLPWLTQQFSFRFKPLYLLRHPFAVAASQLRHVSWNRDLKTFAQFSGRYAHRYQEHADYLESLDSKEELLVAHWCLSNQPALETPVNSQRWLTLYYENLLDDPEGEISRILKTWKLPQPANLFKAISNPSATTVDAPILDNKENQLSKWRHSFDRQQVHAMLAVLKHFNITTYGDGLRPNLPQP